MSKLAFLFSGTGVTVGAGATLLGALAVAGYVSGAFSTEQDTPVVAVPVVLPSAEVPNVETVVVAPAPKVVERAPQTPSFDVVRVETDGAAMIAGSAEAGATIEIRLDNTVVAQVQADRSGKFASFVSLPESKDARVLTLDTGGIDAPKERVIIAPVVIALPEKSVEPEVVATKVEPKSELVPEAPKVADLPEVEALPKLEAVAKATLPVIPEPKVDVTVVIEEAAAAEPKVIETVEETEIEAPVKQVAAAEPQLPVVLLATEEGVRVLQAPEAPKPDAMTSLLASISYDDAGDVSLTGSGKGEFVRVYLDNKPVATTQIAASGDWQTGLPAVDTGIYTLRVDELNDAGDVVARVETPFKRETPEVLAAVTKPEKLVQSVTVQPGATLWAIAQERYGSGTLYARVVAANADTIKDPDLIYPGQVFTVPD